MQRKRNNALDVESMKIPFDTSYCMNECRCYGRLYELMKYVILDTRVKQSESQLTVCLAERNPVQLQQ